jgi:2-(1,2-epoxy-1,2-dihydrophenyl)acetyl-CoA isomerase
MTRVKLLPTVGGVRYIELAHVQSRNALDDVMAAELLAAIREANADSSCGIVVFRSTLRNCFSTGPSLEGLIQCVGTPEGSERLDPVIQRLNEVILEIHGSPKVTAAAIHGYAFGGGLNLFLACDYRIAVESTVCIENFLYMGVTPDLGASYFLPRLIGSTRTLELLLSGRTFTAREAAGWGMFTEVVDRRAALAPRIEALGEKLARADLTRIPALKQLLRASESAPLASHLAEERHALVRCCAESTVRERLEALLPPHPKDSAHDGPHPTPQAAAAGASLSVR